MFSKEEVERGEFSEHYTKFHNPFIKCPVEGCDYVGSKKVVMYRHRIQVHGKGYLFACNLCDEKFMSRDTLTSHKYRVHLKKVGI